MLRYLGIDAGGTSTRAAVVTAEGDCLGFGRAGSGNPVSSGPAHAAEQIVLASATAYEQAGEEPHDDAVAVAAMAGARVITDTDWLDSAAASHGLPLSFRVESDLHATFCSAAAESDGYALVAGTGALAVRLRAQQIELVCDGIGWLLGDTGSGFWIGQQCARAALAALDGRGPATDLSGALLKHLGVDEAGPDRILGRPRAVQEAIDVIYSWRPIELGKLAYLPFEVAGDPVADRIIAEAADAIATTLRAVIDPDVSGPLVLGGSVLTRQHAFATTVLGKAGLDLQTRSTDDGIVGAAVLALRAGGVEVGPRLLERLSASISARKQS